MPAPRIPRRARIPLAVRAVFPVAIAAAIVAGVLLPVLVSGRGPGDPDPAAAVGLTSLRERAGAEPPGTRSWVTPRDAVFVDPSARGRQTGTKATPWHSLSAALEAIVPGGPRTTIVLRGGVYHERVTVTMRRSVVIQPYRHEVVWFDGSSRVTDWRHDGSVWSAPWSLRLDDSPTYTRGAPDNTEPGYVFIDPAHPLAAHPDQVFIDGRPLEQVADAADVTARSFAVDAAAGRLVIGQDPAGHEVRSSDLSKAISVRSPDSIVRGIGIRRYAPSVPDLGSITTEGDRIRLEQLTILDSSTTGFFVTGSRVTVKSVTVDRAGLVGASANRADGLRLDGVLLVHGNTQHFNRAPVSGGFKISRSRGITIEHSAVRDNAGPGIWLDQSIYDARILANDVVGNDGHGVFLEISDTVLVADLLSRDNAETGLRINDTGHVRVWASTIVGNGTDLAVLQDERRADDPSVPGHDERRPFPDPLMPWSIDHVTIADTVVGGGTGADDGHCAICVIDYTGAESAEQRSVRLDGVVIVRVANSAPRSAVVWSRSGGDLARYADARAFSAATGQRGVVSVDTLRMPGPGASLPQPVISAGSRVAVPMPDDVADALGMDPSESIGARRP